MEMYFWRRSSLISRKDKIKNEVIKNKMNVKNNTIDYVKQKQLQWYGHVKRMQEERLPSKVLEWIPPERWKRGRPTTSWIQEITATMREKRIDEKQWMNRIKLRETIQATLSS